MSFDALRSPVQFLRQNRTDADQDWLTDYEAWFVPEGQGISDAVDRAGTPWLRMFDRLGTRVDEILYPPECWRMLKHGYRAGMLWRAFVQKSLLRAIVGLIIPAVIYSLLEWAHRGNSRLMRELIGETKHVLVRNSEILSLTTETHVQMAVTAKAIEDLDRIVNTHAALRASAKEVALQPAEPSEQAC